MGEILERPGRRAEVLVARDELILFGFELDARKDGAGPHYHRMHVDSFFVLEGELEVMVDGESKTIRARLVRRRRQSPLTFLTAFAKRTCSGPQARWVYQQERSSSR